MEEMQNKTFQMRASERWLKRVDEWRRGQPSIPPRAEAIRTIVDEYLDTAEKQQKKKR